MGENPFGYIASIIVSAAIVSVLWFTLASTPGSIVERGWLENKGKFYLVVPAEVVEKRAAEVNDEQV